MGLFSFLGELGGAVMEGIREFNEAQEKYLEEYAELSPAKILKKMDSSSEAAEMSALKALYNVKSAEMSFYELEKITKQAQHRSIATYNYALEIYQNRTNRKAPWA